MTVFRAILSVPAICANEHQLNLVELSVSPGDAVKRGQKLAVLESDKTTFDFESPVDGTIREIHGKSGDTVRVNLPFIAMDTEDETMRHLEAKAEVRAAKAAAKPFEAPKPVAGWTPRALKLAKEAGLDPAKLTDIEPTGPGGRISGDDVTRYLAAR